MFRLNLNRKELIFGIQNEPIFLFPYFFILLLKYYLWFSRCAKNRPDLLAFTSWFKREIRLKKICYAGGLKLEYLNTISDDLIPQSIITLSTKRANCIFFRLLFLPLLPLAGLGYPWSLIHIVKIIWLFFLFFFCFFCFLFF